MRIKNVKKIFENAKLFVLFFRCLSQQTHQAFHNISQKAIGRDDGKRERDSDGVWKHDETSVNRFLSLKMPICLCQFWCILINVIIVYV